MNQKRMECGKDNAEEEGREEIREAFEGHKGHGYRSSLCAYLSGTLPHEVGSFGEILRQLTKFINNCNGVKAAAAANKEGGQLSIVKPPPESDNGAKKLLDNKLLKI
ncbi:hypothetical protein FEM48_Zijuj05G0021700 [Ziziphus jujuba var. spinosa]|uniref:Uncharacterized protein n=1 Tax=Ziziphus jujuba var. spinosa TaxID=714518 RepID=A0A978VC74_ZIZJJ|nr:hypothetical protein FEM48_Zijuj05G0021700 [Ziziphus jujuba var. spinosa]